MAVVLYIAALISLKYKELYMEVPE